MFCPTIVIISYALHMLHRFNDYQHPVFGLLRKCSTRTDSYINIQSLVGEETLNC